MTCSNINQSNDLLHYEYRITLVAGVVRHFAPIKYGYAICVSVFSIFSILFPCMFKFRFHNNPCLFLVRFRVPQNQLIFFQFQVRVLKSWKCDKNLSTFRRKTGTGLICLLRIFPFSCTFQNFQVEVEPIANSFLCFTFPFDPEIVVYRN